MTKIELEQLEILLNKFVEYIESKGTTITGLEYTLADLFYLIELAKELSE